MLSPVTEVGGREERQTDCRERKEGRRRVGRED